MGRDLARDFSEAADLYDEADDFLGFGLSTLAWEGPEEELVRTRNLQPAILTHSIAVLRVVEKRLGPVSMAAGHSLGEFSAHVAAGTMGFREALGAVRLRGELMYTAGTDREGRMAAVLGAPDESVEALCEEASEAPEEIVVPANYNTDGQVVISGDAVAVDRAGELAPEFEARRVVPLAVSGAFHSPLMRPAEDGLREKLEGLEFGVPRFPVYSNVTTGPVTDPVEAKTLLVRQLTQAVRWSASVRAMTENGAGRFLELGPGKVLTGLNRRNAPDVPSHALGEPGDLSVLS